MSTNTHSTRRPNILLLMTDQQRFDSLGCYGAPEASTPHLDQLAASGALVENCYCNNPICTPSRASLMTGGELPDHQVMRLNDVLSDAQVMFPWRLREQGYRTALFGKLHVSDRMVECERRHPHDGFDIYEWCHEPALHTDSPFNGYAKWLAKKDPEFLVRLAKIARDVGHFPHELHATRWTAEATIDFLKQQTPEQPFFCFASVFDPHNPYDDYPVKYADRIDRSLIRRPIEMKTDKEQIPQGQRLEREYGYMGPASRYTGREIEDMRQGYHASVSLIDDEFGRILNCLEEQGLADNTLVIFTSDHGDMLGDHGLMVKGACFHDPCTRVPLLVRWPGVTQAGSKISSLVQVNDLAATICAAAGISEAALGEAMSASRDLRGVLAGDHDSEREVAICAYRHTGLCDLSLGHRYLPVSATMVRDRRYKLSAYHDEKSGDMLAEGQLFDLEEDPLEQIDLWNSQEHAAIRESLSGRLLEWIGQREGGLSLRP